jgi:lysyl-tRNA synthetase class 2
MASLEELKAIRLQKIEILKKAGMEAFPSSVFRDLTIKELKNNFDDIFSKEKERLVSTVGRILAIRGQGAILFAVLQDEGEKIQVVFKKDDLIDNLFELFNQAVDLGDFIQVKGKLFITSRGEKSILAQSWQMASKALLPLPDKWHGLQDLEEIYRRRYLDMIMDKEVYNRFIQRSEIIKFIRNYFDQKGFLEVETPILQNQTGGAMARVFETYHNDYAMSMVLRIALELDHKIIMTGGYKGVYEIGKCFRNEGSDPTHIQEFTMIEWYAAYETLDNNMKWTEELLKLVAKNVFHKTVFNVVDKNGQVFSVDFDGQWPRVSFFSLLKENADIDVGIISLEETRQKAIDYGMDKDEVLKTGKANLLDYIYKKSSRFKIINPTFVTNFPGDLKPLAQQNEDGTAQVAQLIIAGAEITNQYAELVDPVKQRELLISQSQAKENGDEEAMQLDERFLEAMEHGMPPMTGFGMGIDRLVAILTEQKNLRDTIFFPILKPEE